MTKDKKIILITSIVIGIIIVISFVLMAFNLYTENSKSATQRKPLHLCVVIFLNFLLCVEIYPIHSVVIASSEL